MKRNQIVLLAVFIILSVAIGACTRSATGSPSQLPVEETALPNPVSTQSQIMKDIIAGTQTAMAVPVDATPAAGTEVADTGDDEATTEETPEPDAAEPTAKPLPTSTAGPAPVVELTYNTKKCAPGLYICVTGHVKDQTVTVQGSYPWLLNNMEVTFKMAPEGMYDFSKYIVVGTTTYKPDASQGYGFTTTLNVPDSLRGTPSLVVLLVTNDPNYYGSDYYPNN